MASRLEGPSFEVTHEVRDACMCLHVQRAARVLARRYDDAFRALGLSNWQFSLLMSVNRKVPPTISEVSELLGADRTTITAYVKGLAKRDLLEVGEREGDRRVKTLRLTLRGRALLSRAVPLWRRAQRATNRRVPHPDAVRRALRELAT